MSSNTIIHSFGVKSTGKAKKLDLVLKVIIAHLPLLVLRLKDKIDGTDFIRIFSDE